MGQVGVDLVADHRETVAFAQARPPGGLGFVVEWGTSARFSIETLMKVHALVSSAAANAKTLGWEVPAERFRAFATRWSA
ncbi:hypothetical protein [Streptomyces sp. NPDC060031]|uniref:hypothetical protein n=1 Tax=Streptomyces sp. NPDC060031 TaxID=3347043 RepID=UPI00368B5B2E